LSTDKD